MLICGYIDCIVAMELWWCCRSCVFVVGVGYGGWVAVEMLLEFGI
jgi:hypothetical protein